MCKVVVMNVDNRKIRVADIKKKYMNNIIDAAKKCDLIDKVILFGSSIEDRCKESSDIDIAVFGNRILLFTNTLHSSSISLRGGNGILLSKTFTLEFHVENAMGHNFCNGVVHDGDFTLDDFLTQLNQLRKMGSMKKMLGEYHRCSWEQRIGMMHRL